MLAESTSPSRELGFLAQVCRPQHSISFEPSDLNWEKLRDLARYHAVLPLLCDSIRNRAPEDIVGSIQQEAAEYGKCQLRFAATLFQLVKEFESHGIPLLPYKGPALAQQLYGSLALRQSVDLDILVRPCDVARAKELLVRSGFIPSLPTTQVQERFLQDSHCETEFYSETSNVLVELHWAILPIEFRVDLPSESAFDNASRTVVGGTSLRVAQPEETVLMLAAHATKHCWNKLIFVADFVRAISLPGVDYDSLVERAKAAHCYTMFSFGVNLAHELLGYALPGGTSPGLPPRARTQLEATLARLLSGTKAEPSPTQRHRFAMALLDSRLQASQYLWAVIRNPQPADFERVRLPRQLFFLYPLIRISRLLVKGLGALWPNREPEQVNGTGPA